MKKLIILSLLTLFCVSTYAQETIPNSSKDSLKKEILTMLNNQVWHFSVDLGSSFAIDSKLKDMVLFENDCLVFNFKKYGVRRVNLIDDLIVYSYDSWTKDPASGKIIENYSIDIRDIMYIFYGKHTYVKKKDMYLIQEYANKQTLKLFNLFKTYHDRYYVDTLAIQRAKELDYFSKLAQTHHASSEKPTITEEQRKYIVQANAVNKEMKYEKALELYAEVAKINPTSYPEGYYNMALIAAEMKNYSFAILNMKKYLLLVPDANDARAAQDKIYEWELNIK